MQQHINVNTGFEDYRNVINPCYQYLESVTNKFEFFTGVFDEVIDQLENYQFQTPLVVLFVTDHADNDDGSLNNSIRFLYRNFQNIIFRNPKIDFVVCSTMVNLESQFLNLPNLYLISTGLEMDWINTQQYRSLSPVLEKNLSSEKVWLSVNGNCDDSRIHRPITSALLLGLDAEKTGVLRFSGEHFKIHDSWDTYTWYHNYNQRTEIKHLSPLSEVFNKGMQKAKSWVEYTNSAEIYNIIGQNQNCQNFSSNLIPYYKETFVEIINETIFFQQAGLLTEKTFHSIIGCSFPIILSVCGSVNHLRKLGYDMFDDVVDHSYDSEPEPLLRLSKAILDNQRLLFDREYVINAWYNSRGRFEYNFQHWKENTKKMPNNIVNLFTKTITEILSNGRHA